MSKRFIFSTLFVLAIVGGYLTYQNMRSSGADDAAQVGKVRAMTLETCMEWIRPDELIEVTPEGIRLRKKVLKAGLRKRA